MIFVFSLNQLRICHLLETWIRDYPYDFAVRGTAGALSALIKSIISKTYLLHYGSDFLPFLEMLSSLVDQDAAWALKADDTTDGSDDSCSLFEEDDEAQISDLETSISESDQPVAARHKAVLPLPSVPSRERKPSLPLPLVLASGSTSGASQNDFADTSEKQQIKDLVRLAQEVLALDPDVIAQEITKLEVKLFLDIQVCLTPDLAITALNFAFTSRGIGFTTLLYRVRSPKANQSRLSTRCLTILPNGERHLTSSCYMRINDVSGLYHSYCVMKNPRHA